MRPMFLDDKRLPPADGRDWITVRSVSDAIAWVEANWCPNFISFDHDLGSDANGINFPDGYDFAKWLSDRDLDVGCMPDDFSFYAHSMNSGGGQQSIVGLLEGHLAERNTEKSLGRPWPPNRPQDPWSCGGRV